MADNFESTVRVIIERTGIDRDELMRRIWKQYHKSNIVSIEGAASMVGKELGVDLGGVKREV